MESDIFEKLLKRGADRSTNCYVAFGTEYDENAEQETVSNLKASLEAGHNSVTLVCLLSAGEFEQQAHALARLPAFAPLVDIYDSVSLFVSTGCGSQAFATVQVTVSLPGRGAPGPDAARLVDITPLRLNLAPASSDGARPFDALPAFVLGAPSDAAAALDVSPDCALFPLTRGLDTDSAWLAERWRRAEAGLARLAPGAAQEVRAVLAAILHLSRLRIGEARRIAGRPGRATIPPDAQPVLDAAARCLGVPAKELAMNLTMRAVRPGRSLTMLPITADTAHVQLRALQEELYLRILRRLSALLSSGTPPDRDTRVASTLWVPLAGVCRQDAALPFLALCRSVAVMGALASGTDAERGVFDAPEERSDDFEPGDGAPRASMGAKERMEMRRSLRERSTSAFAANPLLKAQAPLAAARSPVIGLKPLPGDSLCANSSLQLLLTALTIFERVSTDPRTRDEDMAQRLRECLTQIEETRATSADRRSRFFRVLPGVRVPDLGGWFPLALSLARSGPGDAPVWHLEVRRADADGAPVGRLTLSDTLRGLQVGGSVFDSLAATPLLMLERSAQGPAREVVASPTGPKVPRHFRTREGTHTGVMALGQFRALATAGLASSQRFLLGRLSGAHALSEFSVLEAFLAASLAATVTPHERAERLTPAEFCARYCAIIPRLQRLHAARRVSADEYATTLMWSLLAEVEGKVGGVLRYERNAVLCDEEATYALAALADERGARDRAYVARWAETQVRIRQRRRTVACVRMIQCAARRRAVRHAGVVEARALVEARRKEDIRHTGKQFARARDEKVMRAVLQVFRAELRLRLRADVFYLQTLNRVSARAFSTWRALSVRHGRLREVSVRFNRVFLRRNLARWKRQSAALKEKRRLQALRLSPRCPARRAGSPLRTLERQTPPPTPPRMRQARTPRPRRPALPPRRHSSPAERELQADLEAIRARRQMVSRAESSLRQFYAEVRGAEPAAPEELHEAAALWAFARSTIVRTDAAEEPSSQ